jgi:citrate lyase beta subunit
MHDVYRLGASLYVPAIHQKLKETLRGVTCGAVRSLIACTEDSIAEADVDRALANLARILPQLPHRDQGPMRFIRPRNAAVLAELLRMDGIEHVHGFVIPKADVDTLGPYEASLGRHDYWLMPTLETSAVFDPLALRELRQRLTAAPLKRHVLALRIGGNDLLKMLGLKRSRGVSIYQTPLGSLIPQLVLAFRAFGIHLTAPVFDFIDDPQTLADEVRQDVQMGLIGKTAIHPDQVPIIEKGLAVTEHELELAHQILAPRREAVFRLHGAMIEKAVHQEWAYATLARAGNAAVSVAALKVGGG